MTTARMFVSSSLAVLVLSAACSQPAPKEAAAVKRDEPKRAPAKADPAKADPAKADPAKAEPETPCVRAGTYRVTSEGPLFLADFDDDGPRLPAATERKSRTSVLDDCSMFTFDETFTVTLEDGAPQVTFATTVDPLGVKRIAVDGCRLTIDVEATEEPMSLSSATFELDFGTDVPTGRATSVWMHTILDGDLGEHELDCGAEAMPLELVPPAERDPK